MSSVEFDYSVGQRVRILEIGRPGIVDALCLEVRGPTYRVVFWNDGARKTEWLYSSEIEAITPQ